jgi:hypothetical protein
MKPRENPGAVGTVATRSRASQNYAHHNEPPTNEQGRPIYLIRVCSTRRDDDIRKLRWLLKALIRRLGLRCLSIETEPRQ